MNKHNGGWGDLAALEETMKKNFTSPAAKALYDDAVKDAQRREDIARENVDAIDVIKALSLRVSKLETQFTPEVIPSDLKLFVWTEVLTSYSNGIIFALAHNVTEARKVIIRDKEDWMDVSEIFEKEPEIVTSPKGFALYGGG